jgi:DNA anti-recombination protein RmuC
MKRKLAIALSIALVLMLLAPVVFASDPIQLYQEALEQALMWQDAFMQLKAKYDTDTAKLKHEKEEALKLYDEAEADVEALLKENQELRTAMQTTVDDANRKLEAQAADYNTKIDAIVNECNTKLMGAEEQYNTTIAEKDRLIQIQDATIKRLLSREKWGWLISGILGTAVGTIITEKP